MDENLTWWNYWRGR